MSWVFEAAAKRHLRRYNPNTRFFEFFRKTRLRKGLYPFLNPEELPNCKRYITIRRNGTAVESAFLDINHSDDRETIIVFHTLIELVRTLGNDDIGFNIVSRDQPWDFTFDLSNGQTRHFEITSVSDDQKFFATLSREEFLQDTILAARTTPSKLGKAIKHFPEVYEMVSKDHPDALDGPEREILNPIFGLESGIYVNTAPVYPTRTPGRQIVDAITSKSEKNHEGKGETILVLDNRFLCVGLDEIVADLRPLRARIESCPFEEVWLYTGYGGHYFGKDGEYALFPLKLHSDLCGKYLTSKPNRMPWANLQA